MRLTKSLRHNQGTWRVRSLLADSQVPVLRDLEKWLVGGLPDQLEAAEAMSIEASETLVATAAPKPWHR